MNDKFSSLLAGLARAWAAVARAFAPAREPGAADGGADTTLFGPGAEAGKDEARRRSAGDGFWGANGDSSYFADNEDASQGPRRR